MIIGDVRSYIAFEHKHIWCEYEIEAYFELEPWKNVFLLIWLVFLSKLYGNGTVRAHKHTTLLFIFYFGNFCSSCCKNCGHAHFSGIQHDCKTILDLFFFLSTNSGMAFRSIVEYEYIFQLYEIWRISVNFTIDQNSASIVRDDGAILMVLFMWSHRTIKSTVATIWYNTTRALRVNDVEYISQISSNWYFLIFVIVFCCHELENFCCVPNFYLLYLTNLHTVYGCRPCH